MATSEESDPQAAAAVPGVDPDIEWVTGIGRSTYFVPGLQPEGKERMTLLLRLNGISAEDFVNGTFNGEFFIAGEEPRRRWTESFHIISLETASFAKTAPFVMSMATDEIREQILSQEGAGRFVESVTLGQALPLRALPSLGAGATRSLPRPAPAARRVRALSAALPPVVLMGIIDDGIAFAHERFRVGIGAGTKTRVECWWLQDGQLDGTAPYGRAKDKGAIDTLLATSSVAGQLDEELFYRNAGLLEYSQPGHKSAGWRTAHGTHVMDLACGFDPAAAPTDRPIACVQLPTRVTQDTSGDLLRSGPYLPDGIRFIIECAKKIALSRPVKGIVINFSYGIFAGPHDGTHPIEMCINDLIAEAKAKHGLELRVVLPAGNSFLERTHAQFALAPGDVRSLPWRVLPDDRTPSYVEIWLPGVAPGAAANSRVTLTVRTPSGTPFVITEQGGPVPIGGFGSVTYATTAAARGYFKIFLKRTAHADEPPPDAPSGTWTIELACTNPLGANGLVHAWVQRDDSLYGIALRGRQSYFDDRPYQRFDPTGCDLEVDNVAAALVRRGNTLNAFATGGSQNVIVMGGYLRRQNEPTPYGGKPIYYTKYSAAGPLAAPAPPRPDAMMVAEDSRVHVGVLAAGSRSGSVVAMGGTSVAAPQIARMIANDLAAGNPGDRAFVAAQAALPLNEGGPFPPGEIYRGGGGRIYSPPLVPLRRYDP